MHRAGLVLALCLTLLGCHTAELIAYTPQAARVENPEQALVDAVNTGNFVPTKVEVSTKYLKAITVLGNGLQTSLLNFSEIAKVELYQYGSYFLVRIFNADGKRLWQYENKTVEGCKEFIDALEAVRKGGGQKAPPAAEPAAADAEPVKSL